MEKNTVLLQDTEAFMHGELDNVTVQQNCIVLLCALRLLHQRTDPDAAV